LGKPTSTAICRLPQLYIPVRSCRVTASKGDWLTNSSQALSFGEKKPWERQESKLVLFQGLLQQGVGSKLTISLNIYLTYKIEVVEMVSGVERNPMQTNRQEIILFLVWWSKCNVSMVKSLKICVLLGPSAFCCH
jgi:hypothetical protein